MNYEERMMEITKKQIKNARQAFWTHAILLCAFTALLVFAEELWMRTLDGLFVVFNSWGTVHWYHKWNTYDLELKQLENVAGDDGNVAL